MLSKITTSDARKNFAEIVNRVAYGKESVILTRKGHALAAMISIEDLKLLQELEERLDIEAAWKARNEPGENISWEDLHKELEL